MTAMKVTTSAGGVGVAGPRAASGHEADPAITLVDRPSRASHVDLMGELQGTGYRDQQWLIRCDGHFMQVTELLYRVLEQADGQHTVEEIARGVTDATEWLVSSEQVVQLIQTTLLPRGLVVSAANTPAAPRSAGSMRSPLAVNMRGKVIGPRIIDPIASVLRVAYAPPVLLAVLLGAAVAHWWLYFEHGLMGPLTSALTTPGALFAIALLGLLEGPVHEFGHAAALRYGGGRARGIGIGLYLLYPVFYTDTTDAYRLSRWARLRTDLGGFYFDLLFSLAMVAAYALTGQEFFLVVVAIADLDIVHQCLPFVRMDGYWALADLTGIPDFFSVLGPFLHSLVPRRLTGRRLPGLPPLKPWARTVLAVYAVLALPFLVLLLFMIVRAMPYLVSSTWSGLLVQLHIGHSAWADGDLLLLIAAATQTLLLPVPVLGTFYIFYLISKRMVPLLWRWTQPTPKRRFVGAIATTAVIGLLAALWVPQLPLDELPFVRPAEPAGVQYFAVTERAHVDASVEYSETPPVGGNHAPIWQNCGFYAATIASEHAVHSMEHGAIWITYRPDLPPQEIDKLQHLAERHAYVLVSQFPDLPAPVVASAWNRQLQLDSAGNPLLEQFVRAFRQGDQAPEHSAPCSGGVGNRPSP